MVRDISTKIRPLEDVLGASCAGWERENSVNALYEGRELTLNAFRNGIFPIKSTQGKGRPSDLAMRLKILTPKQMLQRLPIALTQVKAGNTFENLLNDIRQIIYSL